MFYDEFGSIFFISIATLLTGVCGLILKQCYRTKCQNIKLCFGCIDVVRDIDTEQALDLQHLRRGNSSSNVDNNSTINNRI
jgi:hypothetical protein